MAAAAAEKMEPPPSKMAKKEKTTNVVQQNYFTADYLTELKSLHHKIITLLDNNELMQQVVEMIGATGQYAITQKTFDFDLCAQDRHTIQRLQDFFATLQWRGGVFHVE
jgi:hypothetical protein